MASLSLRIEGEELSATKVLLAASTFVKLLKEIERQVTGKKRATVQWQVSIMSTPSLALISLQSDGKDVEKVAVDTAQEALARMKTRSEVSGRG